MYDRILMPLDGSELAEAVEPYVLPIAEKFDSELILMQAVTPLSKLIGKIPPPAAMAPGAMAPAAAEIDADAARAQVEAETRSAREYLDSVSRRLQERGIRARTYVAEGDAAPAILEHASESDVSLITMSTHGRSGLGRAVFGSVADEVLRNSRLPVLLVRPQE